MAASFQQGNVTFYLFARSQSKMQMNYTQDARPYAQSELVLTQVRHVKVVDPVLHLNPVNNWF